MNPNPSARYCPRFRTMTVPPCEDTCECLDDVLREEAEMEEMEEDMHEGGPWHSCPHCGGLGGVHGCRVCNPAQGETDVAVQ